MAKRNTLKQEYYKTTFNYYWKDSEGKPTIEYVNWLEDKLVKKLNIDDVSNCEICGCREAKVTYNVCRSCEETITTSGC